MPYGLVLLFREVLCMDGSHVFQEVYMTQAEFTLWLEVIQFRPIMLAKSKKGFTPSDLITSDVMRRAIAGG